jgi:hypothetical protein
LGDRIDGIEKRCLSSSLVIWALHSCREVLCGGDNPLPGGEGFDQLVRVEPVELPSVPVAQAVIQVVPVDVPDDS